VLTCRWDDVVAITKPQFHHGKGLGRFDEEIISQLPKSVRIITGAGAGYDWIDVEALAKRGSHIQFTADMTGIWYCNGGDGATEATSDIALMLYPFQIRNNNVQNSGNIPSHQSLGEGCAYK